MTYLYMRLRLLYFVWMIVAAFLLPAAAYAAANAHPHKRILMVMTSHYEFNGTGKKTGLWLDELVIPYYTFRDAGYDVTLCSVEGGPAPIDPDSDRTMSADSRRYRVDKDLLHRIATTTALRDLKDVESYDAVFLVGGHGAMWDMVDNTELTEKLQYFVGKHKIIAAIDHAPAALLSVRNAANKQWIVGKKMTAYTKAEEVILKVDAAVPSYADMSLEHDGAKIMRAKPFQPKVVKDGNLITGQNPLSTTGVVKTMMDALK